MRDKLMKSAVFIFLLILAGCDRGIQTGRATAFNTQALILATIPPEYQIGETVFSVAGNHVAVAASKDNRRIVFFDSKTGGSYETVRDLSFRKGYENYVFVAGKAGKEVVVVDGVEEKLYENVQRPVFASDGRIVYAAKEDGKWVVIAGKRKSIPFQSGNPSLVVSPDGRRLFYVEQRGEKKSRMKTCTIELADCVSGKEYASVQSPVSDKSGAHIAYIAVSNQKKTVVAVDVSKAGFVEKEGPKYDDITLLSYSNKSDHFAYLANNQGKTILNINGTEIPTDMYENAFALVVADNGHLLHSAMVDGKVFAYLDGRKINGEYNGIYEPTFSPDGSNHLFVGDKGDKSVLVINSKETQTFDKIVSPKFSTDGKRIVFRARHKGERFVVVADLQGNIIREHPHYEAVWDVVFSPDGNSIGYGVKIGRELWWKVEKLGE